jgi:uncharacterized protein YciI
MQFMVTGLDGSDEHALNRRLAAREAHIARSDQLVQTGNMLYGVALLDEHDRMIGSVMIVDFPYRAGVDAWLQSEPYVTGAVWQTIDVKPCRVGPSFIDLHHKPTAA